jgi:hypothetical protein
MPSPVINIRFDLTATGSVGAIGTMSGSFRASIEAYAGGQARFSVSPFSVTGSGIIGGVGVARLELNARLFTLSATGSQGDYSRAELIAPGFRSLFGVYRGTMPLFSLRSTGVELVIANYQTYGVNIKNAALTQYTNFPFNHVVRFNGEVIAFTDSGAHLLGADNDNGTEINSVAELPPTDFNTSKMKRMPYIYVGVKTAAAMNVSVIADETEVIASQTKFIGRTRRAKFARGVKSRYWAAKLQNTNGEDFAVDSVEYLPMILERKV